MSPPAEPPPAEPRTAESRTASSPVTADDLRLSVHRAVDALRPAPADGWGRMAGLLEWDCWETVEHLADDLFAYAAQLGPRRPPLADEVPFAWESRRTGGPANAVRADRAAGPGGLLQVLEASGALLTAMVRTTPPHIRAHHVHGVSDPEGFAAMGIVETLVHTHDVAEGLGLPWEPPSGPCARALARLFPDDPAGPDVPDDPWPVLLWCTGRADLPGRPRPATWRWYAEPRA
ncbi:hypothetical protein SUDANB106_02308 [Streptomyces sp. enrichment culture]|uniref:hypothetical protein n=1 Tax=Streptomyces sp. enrichment culture TaxID=1795815 RepID=UPI003F5651DA